MNVAFMLRRAAGLWPGAPAVAVGTVAPWSYAEFAARVAALAGGLSAQLGLTSGDRVAIFAANCAEYLEILYACWHAGMVAVPVNAKLHPRELAFILENCGARAVFVSDDAGAAAGRGIEVIGIGSPEYRRLSGGAPAGLCRVAPDDVAWIFYTSGTTGRPKGAMLTHGNLLFMTLAYFADIDRLAPGDTILHAAPLSHGSGLYALPHVAAGSLNVVPESRGFEAAEIFRLIASHTNVSFFAAPTMVGRLVDSKAAGSAALENLKTIVYGGAPMYLADCRRAIGLFGPRLYHLFGQGESPMTITGLSQQLHGDTGHPRYLERLASCGVARSGVELRIVDPGGSDLPAGETGEIVTRSGCVMKGYWGDREATARTIRDGWLHTGDLGSLDADGFLTIQGRSKDLIISGGSNIYPREIEEVLLLHPAVAECAVIGRPHPEWGEEVVAFVVVQPGRRATEDALDALCLDHIARFKRPRLYRFVDALPKNAYGKVLKTELRRMLSGG